MNSERPAAATLPRHVCIECEGFGSFAASVHTSFGPTEAGASKVECECCNGTGLVLCDVCGLHRATSTIDGTSCCPACAKDTDTAENVAVVASAEAA